MAAAETLLKTGEVAAMIKQGFISSSATSSPFSTSRIPSPPYASAAAATTNHPSPSPPPSFPSSPNPTTLLQLLSQEDLPHPPPPPSSDHQQKWIRVQDRISRILAGERSDWGPGDVELSVSSGDGFRVSMAVHQRVLAAQSRFFAENLGKNGGVVEICECDDVEVYVEVVAMMYCGDLRRRMKGEEVKRVLGLLKVSAAIMFDAGLAACLEYLEAVPWTEDEEEEVVSVLNQLELQILDPVTEVLQRVLVEPSTSSRADAVFLQLLAGILQAKDEKARRDMKALITELLREDTAQNNDNGDRFHVSRETLYHLCHKCLSSLLYCLSEAATMGENQQNRGNLMADIAREADNLHWLVGILLDKKLGDDFVMLWADQTELASLHSKILCMYRFEISRITARLCIAIGRGEILVSKDARFSLLRTWLEALYDDFGWMKRACRTLDKKMVEDGLCKTILTLPMAQQQAILLRWFDQFLKKGDDCPNIQRAFQVWWRRAFVRRYEGDRDQSRLQVAICNYPT